MARRPAEKRWRHGSDLTSGFNQIIWPEGEAVCGSGKKFGVRVFPYCEVGSVAGGF
jgi:hypothetical protein